MKRNIYFSMNLLLSLLVGSVIFFSCKSGQDLTGKITGGDLPADSVVSNLLGDTLCRLLYAPSAVSAYKMRPQQADNDTLIATYAIDYSIGELDASCYSILQFFLKDSTNYVWTDELVKTPFSPNIGFEFTDANREKMFLLLDFNGNQMEIVVQNRIVLHRQFRNEHYLLRFAYGLLPENKYIRSLLNTHK